ncbi:molybdopterin biosynthesis protein CNX [Spatholobus suberectus]|nr:molybdopterin biosynthesis protein CNX [Spatholobus suberectus]
MPREPKSLGVKILWLWTFGTAAILVTNVMRTRIRDLETLMNAEQQQDAATSDSSLVDTLSLPSDPVVPNNKD